MVDRGGCLECRETGECWNQNRRLNCPDIHGGGIGYSGCGRNTFSTTPSSSSCTSRGRSDWEYPGRDVTWRGFGVCGGDGWSEGRGGGGRSG